MNKQSFLPFFSGLVLFSLLSDYALALPEGSAVVSGKAEISHIEPTVMQIQASDKAIIHYKKFNIGKGEKVRFIQPSKHSTVLNRVTSEDPSKILGSLESNGKVFLVNPNGIYFGPKSTINVVSLIASTLSIQDQDFLEENYQFTLGSRASIVNEGLISAEGSIALMAYSIHNKGVIEAKAGSVVLASGEQVVLDFTGDGLLSFAVDGAIKESVIENFGTIKAIDGSIALTLATAKKAISDIVNHDGIIEGAAFIEEGGKIFFASESELLAKQVSAEGGDLAVEGTIKGDKVHLFGRDIHLTGAQIDASSSSQGGEVLIGGEFQGKGNTPYASKVFMDSTSIIQANALEEGDGGLVVLWSKDQTVFNGLIEAKGISLGGMVETSSQGQLGVAGTVHAESLSGEGGAWLLDPTIIYLQSSSVDGTSACSGATSSGTTTYGNCSSGTCYVLNSSINSSTNNVILQAYNIYINSAVNMTSSGKGIEFKGCDSSSVSQIRQNVVTNGGTITFTDLILQVDANITIRTTGSDNTTGAKITIPSVQNLTKTSEGLTLSAGTSGAVSVSSADVSSSLNIYYIKIESAKSVITTGIKTRGPDGFQMPTSAPLYLNGTTGTVSIATDASSSTGGTLITGPISDHNANSVGLKLSAGTNGTMTIGGDIGGTSPPVSCQIGTSTGQKSFALPNITTSNGGAISIYPPCTLAGFKTLTSGGGNVSFFSTIDGTTAGSQGLTITAGSGAISLNSIGSSVALGNFSLSSSVSATLSSIKTRSGTIAITPNAYIGSTATIDTTDEGTSSGASITFSGTIDSSSTATNGLTLNAGSATISTGDIGGTYPLGAVTVKGTANFTLPNITTNAGAIDIQAPVSSSTSTTTLDTTDAGSSSSGANITFKSVDAVENDLTLKAGGIGVVDLGTITSLKSLDVTNAYQIKTIGIEVTNDISFPSTSELVLTQTSTTVTSTAGNVTLGEISGDGLVTESLIINALGAVTIESGGLEGLLIEDLQVNADSIIQNGSVVISGEAAYTATSSIELAGNLTSNSGSIVLTGPLLISATDLILTASSDITVDTVDTTTGDPKSLTLISNLGTVSFEGVGPGSVGVKDFSVIGAFITPTGIVDVTGTIVYSASDAIDLAEDLSAGKDINLIGPVSLSNPVEIIAGGSINSSQGITSSSPLALSLNAGSLISLGGDLGTSSEGLGAVNLLAGTAVALGSIYTEGEIITINSPMNLTKNATLSTVVNDSAGANLVLSNQSIDGGGSAFNLTLSAGSGTISVGILGATYPLGEVTILGTDTFTPSNITTKAGSISIQPEVTLSSNTTFDTTKQAATGADITFSSTVDGAFGLALKGGTSGTVTFKESVSGLADLTVTAGSITLGTVSTEAPLTTTGSIDLTGSILLSNAMDVTAGGSIAIRSAISSSSPFDITLVAGTSVTLEQDLGSQTAGMGEVNITAGSTVQVGSIYTEGESILINQAIDLTKNTTIATTAGGASGHALTLQMVGGGFNAFSLTLDAGIGILSVGDLGLPSALGAVTILGTGDFTLPNMYTSGGKVLVHPSVSVSSDVIVDTTFGKNSGSGSTVSGADIFFSLAVDGPESLSLNAGTRGDVFFTGSLGDAPIDVLTIVNANHVTYQDILANALVQANGTGITTFKGGVTILGSGGIHLTGRRFVFLEPVSTTEEGASIIINNSGELSISSQADFWLKGPFLQVGTGSVVTGGDMVMSSSTPSYASIGFKSSIVLSGDVFWDASFGNGKVFIPGSIEGASKAFRIDAGIGQIVLGGSIGESFPLGSLEFTGMPILLRGKIVSTLGNQLYHSPLFVSDGINFRAKTGDITFEDLLNGSAAGNSAVFSMGGGSCSFLKDVGSINPLNAIAVYNSGEFSSQAVAAGSLTVSGGLSTVYLNGPVNLSGPVGLVLDGGPIYLGGAIDANRFFMRSQGSILNLTTPNPITIPGNLRTGLEYINAIGGTVGTLSSPIEINTVKPIALGASSRADLQGTLTAGLLEYISSNVPCIVTLNGVVLRDCNTIPNPAEEFNSLPKYFFYLPGIYSSWDNLSNGEYFLADPLDDNDQVRNRTLFWQKPEEPVEIEVLTSPAQEEVAITVEDIEEPSREEVSVEEERVFIQEEVTVPESSKNPQKEEVDFDFTVDFQDQSYL